MRRLLGATLSQGDNSDKAATTAYVDAGLATKLATNGTLPFANITSKPTTLAGYGITDGLGTSTSYSGDVTGTYSALNVGKIQGKVVPTPTVGNDQKALMWDNTSGAFIYGSPSASAPITPWKISVRVASTANIIVSNPGTSVFDTITLSNGNRILLKDQTTQTENGIYVFNGSGSALTRDTDCDTTGKVIGMTVMVTEGSSNGDSFWYCPNDSTLILGSTSLTFIRMDGINKEPTINAGTTSQYYRGDKSWQTLNTANVAESGNLYHTDARSIAAPLTGYTVGSNTILAATDTVLQAFQKVQGQINAIRTPIVSTVAYTATWNLNANNTDVARMTLTGPCTINLSGGVDGQKLLIEIIQDATGGRVATLGTGIAYGSDITSYTGNTTASKTDILGFEYNSATSKFRLIAVAKGY